MTRIWYIMLLLAQVAVAAPSVSEDGARFRSYQKLLAQITSSPSTVKRPEYTLPEQRKTIDLLAKRSSPPVTPQDILDWSQISEIIFSPDGPNRPINLIPEELESKWRTFALETFTVDGQISLAPFPGFIVMDDGSVHPFELYSSDRVRLVGFMYKK